MVAAKSGFRLCNPDIPSSHSGRSGDNASMSARSDAWPVCFESDEVGAVEVGHPNAEDRPGLSVIGTEVVLGTLPALVRGEAVERSHESRESVRREVLEILEQSLNLGQTLRQDCVRDASRLPRLYPSYLPIIAGRQWPPAGRRLRAPKAHSPKPEAPPGAPAV